MIPVGLFDYPVNQRNSGVQGDSGFAHIVDLTVPPVNGSDRRDVVPARRETLRHEVRRELCQPISIGRSDNYLADVIHV